VAEENETTTTKVQKKSMHSENRILRQMQGEHRLESQKSAAGKLTKTLDENANQRSLVSEGQLTEKASNKQTRSNNLSLGGSDENGINTKVQKKSLPIDVLKKIMSKRRQRRKEIQAGKCDGIEGKSAPTKSKTPINGKEKCSQNFNKAIDGVGVACEKKPKKSLTLDEKRSRNLIEKLKDRVSETTSKTTLNVNEEGSNHPDETKGEQVKRAMEKQKKDLPVIEMPPQIIRSTKKVISAVPQSPKIESSHGVFVKGKGGSTNMVKTSYSPQESFSSTNISDEFDDQYPDDESQPEITNDLMVIDLSPIKSVNVSKHICELDTSNCTPPDVAETSSEVSTPKYFSPDHSLVGDMPDQTTPKTANRDQSSRSAGSIVGTMPDYAITKSKSDDDSFISEALSAPILLNLDRLSLTKKFSDTRSEVVSPSFQPDSATKLSRISVSDNTRSNSKRLASFTNNKKRHNSQKRSESRDSKFSPDFQQICDTQCNASSVVRSLARSTASSGSGITSLSSKANRLLAGRRGKTKRKQEQGSSAEQMLAKNLARRMLCGENNENHKEKRSSKNPMRREIPCKSNIKDAKQETKLDRNHRESNKNGCSRQSVTSTTSTVSIKVGSDIGMRRDPMHFNSYYSSFDDPEIPIIPAYRYNMDCIESTLEASTSTDMSSNSNEQSVGKMKSVLTTCDTTCENKNSEEIYDQSCEGPQLMTWVSNKLTDMKIDMLATEISQKFDGANTAVHSCGDGALGNTSMNSTYSSAVRISQLDFDEASSDEEVAIEVEYVPKDIGLEACENQADNILRAMHPGAIPQRTGESYFAVSPNVSACSTMNAAKLNGSAVPILNVCANQITVSPTEKKIHYNYNYKC